MECENDDPENIEVVSLAQSVLSEITEVHPIIPISNELLISKLAPSPNTYNMSCFGDSITENTSIVKASTCDSVSGETYLFRLSFSRRFNSFYFSLLCFIFRKLFFLS